MTDEMTSEAQEELLPPTRKRQFSFSGLFHEFLNPVKYHLLVGTSPLQVGITRDFLYPVIIQFGWEATIELEVGRNDVNILIEIIENHILSDTENAHKLRSLDFWESRKVNEFGKVDKELLLSSDWLWVRRIDGFWQLTTPQFIGKAEGDSYSKMEWRKLCSVLTKSLLEASQPKIYVNLLFSNWRLFSK